MAPGLPSIRVTQDGAPAPTSVADRVVLYPGAVVSTEAPPVVPSSLSPTSASLVVQVSLPAPPTPASPASPVLPPSASLEARSDGSPSPPAEELPSAPPGYRESSPFGRIQE